MASRPAVGGWGGNLAESAHSAHFLHAFAPSALEIVLWLESENVLDFRRAHDDIFEIFVEHFRRQWQGEMKPRARSHNSTYRRERNTDTGRLPS